jgi:predicted PhzF superfamily epimerase YddE/YHI9
VAERRDEWIRLDFPITPAAPIPIPDGLDDTLGTKVMWTCNSALDLLVEVESEEALRTLTPDLMRISRLPVRGVIVTARSFTKPYDFVSRFFAPQSGINEDPVTGSAHCSLGPYWAEKLGKQQLLAYQASSRAGTLRLELGDSRIAIEGQAVTVASGELLVD